MAATKTSPKKRSSSKTRVAKKPPAKKGTGRAPKKAAPEPIFGGQTLDIWGVVLVLFGLVAAFSIYVDATGALGRGIAGGTGWLLGLMQLLVPPAAVVAGLGLIRADEDNYDIPVPYVVGALFAMVSTTGLLHLAKGRPQWGTDSDVFGNAGGVVGLAIADPLQAFAATWGATLVLLTLGLLAFVMLTGTPVAEVAGRISALVGPAVDRLRGGVQSQMVLDITDDYDGDLNGELDLLVSDREPVAEGSSELEDEGIYIPVATPATNDAADETTTEGPESDETEPARISVPFVNVPESPKSDASVDGLAVAPADGSSWVLPPMNLLKRSSAKSVDTSAVEERGRVLEAALAEHNVETRLVGMTVGPTVTRFELELGKGVKVSRVTSLQNDIAYSMASPDVRILAPIPGRQAIGVEVPNTKREVVAVGDILASPEARAAKHPLEVAVGRDINGHSILMNLAEMPHILIAGQTGAGKSSGLNSIITSIMMRTTPDEVRLVLIDPKRVEMGQYDKIPHLLTAPVTDPKKAANALAWAVREMERRYDLLSECGFRDITGYNAAIDADEIPNKLGELDDDGTPKSFRRLPFILVVVDELADLMMVAARDVEESVCRLAQMARAVGIHLVIATQRPSVNVITGLIKANVPARLSFKVSSLTDSRVILDQPGAERLVGKGDLLFLGPGSSAANRVQGCWVDEAEVRNIVKHWKAQAPALIESENISAEVSAGAEHISADSGPAAGLREGGSQLSIDNSVSDSVSAAAGMSITDDPPTNPGSGDNGDELFMQAVELVVQSQLGSTSMLQRKLRVGFARAGRLMDIMEESGIVGPSEGSKARAVLLRPEELEQLKENGWG